MARGSAKVRLVIFVRRLRPCAVVGLQPCQEQPAQCDGRIWHVPTVGTFGDRGQFGLRKSDRVSERSAGHGLFRSDENALKRAVTPG